MNNAAHDTSLLYLILKFTLQRYVWTVMIKLIFVEIKMELTFVCFLLQLGSSSSISYSTRCWRLFSQYACKDYL